MQTSAHTLFKKFILLLAVMACCRCLAQSLSPQVINSAGGGGSVGSSGVQVYYNIGEPLITTLTDGNFFVTQGFLQSTGLGEPALTASAFITPNSCADKADGAIKITAVLSGIANQNDFQFYYYWTPSNSCSAANTCSTVKNLAQGTYSVLIISHYNGSGAVVADDTAKVENIHIAGSREPCQIIIYNGVSPNGDNENDFFYIENIEQFPGNRVEIYNRWGGKLFETKHYNNTGNYWTGTVSNTSTEIAPSGTYFYVIELGNGTAPVKGWLELTSHK